MKTKILDLIARDMPEALPRPLRGERCPRCHGPARTRPVCQLCNPQRRLAAPESM